MNTIVHVQICFVTFSVDTTRRASFSDQKRIHRIQNQAALSLSCLHCVITHVQNCLALVMACGFLASPVHPRKIEAAPFTIGR